MFTYKATILRILDGDTVQCTIDLGFKIYINQTIRLYGIDTPELHSKDPKEREASVKAMVKLAEFLPAGKTVVVKTEKDATEKYGRMLGVFYTDETQSATVNEMMVKLGLAKPYYGGKKA